MRDLLILKMFKYSDYYPCVSFESSKGLTINIDKLKHTKPTFMIQRNKTTKI